MAHASGAAGADGAIGRLEVRAGDAMNCMQAREHIFAADVLCEDAFGDELVAHLGVCEECRAMLARLRSVEDAIRALPTPAESEAAKGAFLRRLRWAKPAGRPGAVFRHMSLRPAWRAVAMAASVLILIGLVGWLLFSGGVETAMASDAVLDRLVAWNVELGQAESSEECERILAQTASLEQAMNQVRLTANEKNLAAALLENGKWLSYNTDPLARAERFQQLADLLVKRLESATAAHEPKTIARLSRYYGVVQSRGFDPQMARVESMDSDKPERSRRWRRLKGVNAAMQAQVRELAKQLPDVTRRQILRDLELTKRHHRNATASRPAK